MLDPHAPARAQGARPPLRPAGLEPKGDPPAGGVLAIRPARRFGRSHPRASDTPDSRGHPTPARLSAHDQASAGGVIRAGARLRRPPAAHESIGVTLKPRGRGVIAGAVRGVIAGAARRGGRRGRRARHRAGAEGGDPRAGGPRRRRTHATPLEPPESLGHTPGGRATRAGAHRPRRSRDRAGADGVIRAPPRRPARWSGRSRPGASDLDSWISAI